MVVSPSLPAALSALGQRKQFILFKLVERAGGKSDKIPCHPYTGQPCDAHDPANWTDHPTVYALAPLMGPEYGIGFVLTADSGLWCLDIDSALQADNTWSPLALSLIGLLPGAAVEVSVSGRGLHVWGKGLLPAQRRIKNTELGLELYNDKRFIALGYPNAVGSSECECSLTIQTVTALYFAAPTERINPDAPTEWTNTPSPDWRGPTDDVALIQRMMGSRPSAGAIFGGKAAVQDLWNANAAVLRVQFPAASEGQEYGASEADAALASHLAFWTGRDCERMARLMHMSQLRRDKWDRDDYIKRTILGACQLAQNVYCEKPKATFDAPKAEFNEPVAGTDTLPHDGAVGNLETGIAQPVTRRGNLVNGSVWLTPDDQLRLWNGYTYVADGNYILTATGQQWGPDAFKNRYGGWSFVMDAENGKASYNAFEAFTQSRALRMPKVDHSAFRPDLAPDAIWERDGASYANTYRKLSIPRVTGDATPFLKHLAKVLPIKRDRDILLAYMAAIVQYQGKKFQWAPVIQGVEGNGKTLFSRCVAEAVGLRYCHFPRASELAEKFNSWLVNKIFIGVEDIYFPEGRQAIIETLKPMVTNSRQPIRAMQKAEATMDICANFIVNSNHKDGIRKTSNDRRWCVMFCAQQTKEDKQRDGLDRDYFVEIYGWLENGGYAIVSEFLHTYEIPAEYGLSCLMGDAPVTSSTEEALHIGLGAVEVEVLEAIESQTAGFCGGWVSSLALDNFLRERRLDSRMPRSRRSEMLAALGYVKHPRLPSGRLTLSLTGTNERPVLYIKDGHPFTELQTSAEVLKAYESAQRPGAAQLWEVGRRTG